MQTFFDTTDSYSQGESVILQRTRAQLALRFVIQTTGVSVAIPAAFSLAELEENLGALALPALSAQKMRELSELPGQRSVG